MDWQPMENAPKDGTLILLRVEDDFFGSCVRIGQWTKLRFDAKKDWRDEYGCYIHRPTRPDTMRITGWQPLPKP